MSDMSEKKKKSSAIVRVRFASTAEHTAAGGVQGEPRSIVLDTANHTIYINATELMDTRTIDALVKYDIPGARTVKDFLERIARTTDPRRVAFLWVVAGYAEDLRVVAADGQAARAAMEAATDADEKERQLEALCQVVRRACNTLQALTDLTELHGWQQRMETAG